MGVMCLGACCKGGKQDIRVSHMLILFAGILLAIILRWWGGQTFLPYLSLDTLGICVNTVCYGVQAVYRISLAMAVFFATFGILAYAVPSATSIIGNYIFQILLILTCLAGFWFIPDAFYEDVFSKVAICAGALFLLFQVMVLVSGTNTMSESLSDADSMKKMIAITVVAYSLALGGIIFCFLQFGGGKEHSCDLQNTSLSITVIMIVVTSLISINPAISGERGGRLMVSAVLAMYTVWMNYSALSVDPSACNTVTDRNNWFWIVVGLIWSGISVIYSAWTVGTSDALRSNPDLTESLVDSDDDETPSRRNKDDEQQESRVEYTGTENMPMFFLVLSICSLYMSMLLTDWGDAEDLNLEHALVSSTTMWVQLVTEWLTFAMYTWFLIAPYLFPDRDFN